MSLAAGLLLCAGCTAPPQPFRAGAEQLGPLGWFDYCHRNPGDPGCARAMAGDTVEPAGARAVAGP